jgi:glycosyltransferase involved in cell wall biosynthesis
MRFAVDAHAIGQHLTGNEVYVRNLLNAFAAVDRRSEYIAYVSNAGAHDQVPRRFLTRRIAANPFLRLGGDLSYQLRRDRPSLIHVQYTAPFACPVPVVVSVHDISFLEHPEFFTKARQRQLQWTVRRTVMCAARVLTGSEFSREAIVRAYGLPPEKVIVVANAADAGFRPVSRAHAAAEVLRRFRIAEPYILCVGDLQTRKNQTGLIRAFAELVRSHPQFPHSLLLAGKDTWMAGRVREAARQSGVASRIRFTGFVSDDDLLYLYNACDLFVFPSLYEGFGLPVLEAMACGRAVCASNTSAIPEVADGAAILFDPRSTGGMTRAILDLLRDSELRSRMERLGQQRAAQFDWQKTARKTLEVYREVAAPAGSQLGTRAVSASRR